MGKPTSSIAAKYNGEPNENIGHTHPLRAFRKEHFVTLDDLSFLTGISMASLSRIERYKQYPLISAAQKIIKATGGYLKPEDFFGKKI
jgi:DNA-binding XRE family transcriptional regulator